MSAGDIQPRCFDTRRMRGLSRERDVLETIARETEKLTHVDEGREKSNEKKKDRRETDDGTTTKSRAWLERRDDDAGKGRGRKKKRSME